MAVHDIPFTEDLNIIKMLVDEPIIGEWNLQGEKLIFFTITSTISEKLVF